MPNIHSCAFHTFTAKTNISQFILEALLLPVLTEVGLVRPSL